ncbi:PREDICTED: vacuolar protein sorting-associated protein 13D isoform X2 [Dinoponera quadriceps]|uniref:Vacuolar protein sorting-associated protein 13D isoform X2 n=1 Tax=Dinoponera quadriceps TaxID=609295 RepID=A0A6P3X1N2_DINQU|nr:PREDICTED: vacuolar protein sorting-associated protein 13D isoform X2 [Dinoponera quadriceps]
MLEGLVAWVLNNYLGKYVENLNTDQLSIALLSGEVELENLPLRREALRHIGLPVEIKAGFIGKIRLQVPVRQIRTASWVIGMEQLYLVAGPINLDEYDSEAEEQAILEYKLSRLDALEARWRADVDHDPGYYATSYSSWVNYGTSLMTNIIENLQLNIKDVHIRYEDGVTLPGDNGIALGITIGALTAQSCDASWIPGSTSWNLTDASFKLMELDSLAIYWNHVKKDQLFSGLNLGDLAIAMSKLRNGTKTHILSPVNARAHVKRDRTERPLRSINKPRMVVDLLLDEVPLSVTDVQYEEMVKCVKELERIDRRKQQRRCRPKVSVREDCTEWWRYAARCHLGRETLKPRPSWKVVLLKAEENVLYVQAYAKLLGTPTSSLPAETKRLKEKVECERSFDELRILREVAMRKTRPAASQEQPNESVPQGRGMLEQWFPQWWGWYSKTPHSNTQNATSTTTFDGELLDVLADTVDDDTLLRRDTVFGQFNFALVQGAISLCTERNGTRTVIELKFEKVNLSYESRPRFGSHRFSISLGALYLHDFLTENSMFPILVQPQVASSVAMRARKERPKKQQQTSPLHLFELTYEKKPLHVNTDHLLHVYSKSLDVVYNPTVIHWLIEFMCKPLRSSSNQRLQAMKRRTRKQLMKNWEQILDGDFVYRSSWDLRFKISAPQILLVESFVDSNAAIVIVDLGKLHLSNDANLTNQATLRTDESTDDDDDEEREERFETPCSTPPGSQENGSLHDFQGLSETELHKKLYDQYSIDLVDLQILVVRAKDNWKYVRTRGMSTLHLLERFNISLQIERRVFVTSDPNFPSVTVSGNLPRLVVHVNEYKVGAMRLIYNLLSNFSGSPAESGAVSAEPESPRKEDPRSLSHAVMVQFIIDQMTFELQSRGRSVAELQVSGVRAALSKRMADLSVSLSVHGLLLVDAIQVLGPDFELLMASHKHVGMDSVSGSLRDSEPTSPVSPAESAESPRLTSPVALTDALSSLARNSLVEKFDSEALIVVELTLVDDPAESLRMANIQFNNLDITANQETIVELMGFFRRILPLRSARVERRDSQSEGSQSALGTRRTEITFDFHRLNVLLLRAVMQGDSLVGQKIATATMSDARIQATLAADTSISGSLGGVQIFDQTPTGKTHQRILSVGRDPLADPPHHPLEHSSEQPEAFRFVASRRQPAETTVVVELTIRVASVWYTHAPHLISELRSCADEFKQYLRNLARQISAAATDMAIGLVNAAEDWTPRKSDLEAVVASLRLDVLLESPVLVIPRSSHSRQVFVAHLGTMSLRHEPEPGTTKVTLEVRDMNLYSVEVSAGQLARNSSPMRVEEMYRCGESAEPILHDTMLKILVEKEGRIVQVHGAVITPLKVSLSRGQYEQSLDTIDRLSASALLGPSDLPLASSRSPEKDLSVRVSFELPILSVELKRQQPLVELSMRDFVVRYEKLDESTEVQVALRSLLMEDLLCPVGSRHRFMMRSSAPARARLPTGVSRSCPDLACARRYARNGSLPDRLEADALYGAVPAHWRPADTPDTPPPGAAASEENLVLVSVAEKDRRRIVTVDFNCLDLVVSVDSWMVVFDFLGVACSEAAARRAAPASRPDGLLRSETEIEVRSLTLVLLTGEREIAKANVSNASMYVLGANGETSVHGQLGSMSLLDLTPHGRRYRERFLTAGRKALNFHYSSCAEDARLKLEMSAVHYVHTQRFVAELHIFFGRFSQLWGGVMRPGANRTRLSLELRAGAPLILLPVSSRSDELVLLDLGELTARNRFDTSSDCVLEVMLLELVNMDVYATRRLECDDAADAVRVGGFLIEKMGSSLLTDKCQLRLRVERNLDTHVSRAIPDLSVHGVLSTMDCALDPAQYMLIRGLLSHNIGESLDDLRLLARQAPLEEENSGETWTRSCVTLELVNVTVRLHPSHNIAALACVNFIKSRLTLDSLSDGSQDIDLVSQEILVTDTRFQNEPADRRCNVFTRILQPLRTPCAEGRVQAEVHHRKREAYAATTVLLHSMRLTAILDWWEAVRDFLLLDSPEPARTVVSQEPGLPIVLKINITGSELVIVEDTSVLDTNAVILKTTAVLSYRSTPQEGEKPLSCNLSQCELFSCVLGMENETALSIIDPVGASLDLTRDECLEVQLQPLCVRLSYHDVTMFSRMLSSVPKQTSWAKRRSSADSRVSKLTTLGFTEVDCRTALDRCDGQLDDAALWLTQNAEPSSEAATNLFRALELQASCVRICVIDDCRDADVPLLEITLTDFSLRQVNRQPGVLSATFGVDYYNRVLSGWEPFIEPWRASIQWEQAIDRLYVAIDSQDSVDLNVTLTLVELVQLVKHNWTQDYYLSDGPAKLHRRRSPFVPFALKNDTGCRLWFKTFIATAGDAMDTGRNQTKSSVRKDDTWMEVMPGDTTSFTFEGRGKLRHHETHTVRRHQIVVQVEGWKPVEPVTVDRVGIYFRHANADIAEFEMLSSKARLVFAVELEGSARKLVTVRSALQVANKLSHAIEIKMETSLNQFGYLILTSANIGKMQLPARSVMSLPLSHIGVQMCFKPLIPNSQFQYCTESVNWTVVKKPMEVMENHITCRTNQNNVFRMCVAVRRNNYPVDGTQVLPGHTITVMAPITMTNLLPYELTYEANAEGGRISPGCSADLHCSNLEEQLEINIQLDGYPGSGTIILPPNSCSFTARLKLLDSASRILHLQAAVTVEKGSAVQINVTAPYWIINKTGLPLVFRQEGVGIEAAGQFEEHEKARMIAPLLFSFSDEEASRTVSVRVGIEVHPHGIPQWSQHFYLQPGIHVQRLRISLRDGRPDIVYLISVAIRGARGRYGATTVVTLSPRYQFHNKSSYTLQLAQKCFTTTVSHPDAQATYITIMPDCHMPFHWPRLDKDLLLCVRITDVRDCMWSGGIKLDNNYSLTINVRDVTGKMHFLRVDVVLQETTYFIVFTDADTMPPPIRVDNFSAVPLIVNQIKVPDSLQWTVRPHSSVPYALDEPIQTAGLILTAPGGATASYNLNVLGESRGLTYENFIYIAFTGTFKTDNDLGTGENDLDPLDMETQRLVLEAGPGGWVALRRKQYGARSQLWRMTGDGQLQHEGSSPPRDKHSRDINTIYVLDIAGTAPQPFTYCALALRKPDPRRRSTQTWRFTDDGRLCCVHKNMCVQSKDGFMGLYEGSEAVLGPETSGNPPPIEQRVGRQKLRPGSGFLTIRVTTDGPTRVLQALDIKERNKMFALLEERDWWHIAVSHRPTQIDADVKRLDSRELNLKLDLPAGLGLSIVSQRPVEELLFARLAEISLNLVRSPLNTTLDLSVADVQIDNQLFEAQCTSVLFVSRPSRTEDEIRPALHIAAEKLRSKNQNAEIYKHVIVSVKPLCVHLEEKFILKLAAFLGIGKSELEVPVDENDFKAQRFISEVSAAHAKRYYFGALELVPNQVKLSVLTTTKLPQHLQAVKRKLGLTLINFENATIELKPFTKEHPFESSQFLMHSIVKHYKDELMCQAAVILGSVDFLGNPLGFMNDVTEGVSGLIYEGSVKTLVKNVTHGISNSAAKVTESLSDGLGRVIMDERHEEARQRIRANTTGSSDHLVAGLKGFGFGLLGGVTSIFKQTYDGAANEGFPGFFAGFGKGVVGTITKPVVGVLDLATETASAVRETSRSSHRAIPKRDRPPRVVSGSTGLLPPYNRQQAEGQEFLYSINDRDYSELFVAYECLRSGTENLRVLVSNERVRVISGGTKAVVTEVSLANLLCCKPMQKMESNSVTLYYIEMISLHDRSDIAATVNSDGHELLRRPKVRCDNEEVAKRVSRQISYAKGMYEERSLTLSSSDNMLDDVQYYK